MAQEQAALAARRYGSRTAGSPVNRAATSAGASRLSTAATLAQPTARLIARCGQATITAIGIT